MNTGEIEAKTEAVQRALEDYQTRLGGLDTRGAVDASERRIEMDCRVCTGVGQHLTALAVAVQTAPHPDRKEEIRDTALQSAEEIAADLTR